MEEAEDGSSKIGGGEVVDGRFRRGEGLGGGMVEGRGGGEGVWRARSARHRLRFLDMLQT